MHLNQTKITLTNIFEPDLSRKAEPAYTGSTEPVQELGDGVTSYMGLLTLCQCSCHYHTQIIVLKLN